MYLRQILRNLQERQGCPQECQQNSLAESLSTSENCLLIDTQIRSSTTGYMYSFFQASNADISRMKAGSEGPATSLETERGDRASVLTHMTPFVTQSTTGDYFLSLIRFASACVSDHMPAPNHKILLPKLLNDWLFDDLRPLMPVAGGFLRLSGTGNQHTQSAPR